MGTKLKRVLTLFAVSTLCTNLLAFTKPVKALADEGINKTIVVIKDNKSDLKDEIVDKESNMTLKRVSAVEEVKNLTLQEVRISMPRTINCKYYVYPIRDSKDKSRGWFWCRPTTTWNRDKDPNKKTGNDGASYKDGYVVGYSKKFTPNSIGRRSLAEGTNGCQADIIYEPYRCHDGGDFLNQEHEFTKKGFKWKLVMDRNFNDNIKVTTSREAVLADLGLSPLSDLNPSEFNNRPAYMEHRVGHDDGIDYGTYIDYIKKASYSQDPKTGMWHTNNFSLPDDSDTSRWKVIKGKKALLVGEYGDETFNYYVPAKVLNRKYKATYQYKQEKPIPPEPHIPPIPPVVRPDSSPCGRIVYNPDKCKWTNRGKTSNGVGDYTVDVKATKPTLNLRGYTESHKHSHKRGSYCYCTRSFDVRYDLSRIETSGASNDTIYGSSGTVHIRQEGEGQRLSSIGRWGRAQYSARYAHSNHDSCDVPDPPCEPQGRAGTYDIDWTDPVIKVKQKAPNKWLNNPYTQPLDITITDNLSGFDSSKSYIQITDTSHYKHNYKVNLTEASLNEVKHWDLSDGIYKIDIVVYDRAGNHSEYHDKWFKVDGISPDITITDQGYHRAIDSLTFDTDVSDNIEELDELTVSGWGTYGSSRATLENQTKAIRPITYPNIKHEDTNYTFYYKVEDLATNQTTKSFVTSVVREYWKWAHKVLGSNFDTEVPVKILSTKDTKSLEGFKKSRTIDFDTWRGMKVEVWYKFVSYHNCNFIRVIHYDDPSMPLITNNGEKLYPDGKGGFKDAPPLSNEIGLEVGMDEYVETFGKHTNPMPIIENDLSDNTTDNHYVNGDVRHIDKSGKLKTWKEKGYGSIIPNLTNYTDERITYHTTNRYRIEVTMVGQGTRVEIYDRNNKLVASTTTSR